MTDLVGSRLVDSVDPPLVDENEEHDVVSEAGESMQPVEKRWERKKVSTDEETRDERKRTKAS